MSINNPAAAQVMVAAARASLRQRPGSYAVLEIPLIDFYTAKRRIITPSDIIYHVCNEDEAQFCASSSFYIHVPKNE